MTEIVLFQLLSYLIGIASSLRTDAFLEDRRKKLAKTMKRSDSFLNQLSDSKTLRAHLRQIGAELSKFKGTTTIRKIELPLFALLADEIFQDDLADWLVKWEKDEARDAKNRLIVKMELALREGGATPQQVTEFTASYFDLVESFVNANPLIARWRQQLCLNYLAEQVPELRRLAASAAGVYSADMRAHALKRYCEIALSSWDIIDLSGLPEGDREMATERLLLRQLYIPLRINVEVSRDTEAHDDELIAMEKRRGVARPGPQTAQLGPSTHLNPNRNEVVAAAVGDRLKASRRLVILGDPGGGKTTMMRWMATAYLLRQMTDPTRTQLPDINTLPDVDLVPVMIRCRDLSAECLSGSMYNFLSQTLSKTELSPAEADIIRAVVTDRMAEGSTLFIVDGLDEITDASVRVRFCRQLEQIATAYPLAWMVVTSRIVGYRAMPYRMRSGFEHTTIADLEPDQKDDFARRWCKVTPPPETANQRAQDLIRDLHSSDRIDRMTTNPMLLTTLALVKRKVGKLPSRRVALYTEAIDVLLNWNPQVYTRIEAEEAVPQLEYVAYEMCKRGAKHLSEDDIVSLFERARRDFPNIRAMKRRSADEFLELLEARSGLLYKSGSASDGAGALYEFRHLTFQEFLAARAMADGRYPERDKSESVPSHLGRLAGDMARTNMHTGEEELEVRESWREPIRLCIPMCKDDDVDEALKNVLGPQNSDDLAPTSRARAILAALCLADEPNVGEGSANLILESLVLHIDVPDGSRLHGSALDIAVDELARSEWNETLDKKLLNRFLKFEADAGNVGGVCGRLGAARMKSQSGDPEIAFRAFPNEIENGAPDVVCRVSLTVMLLAFFERLVLPPRLVDVLFGKLARSNPEAFAAAWALIWIFGGRRGFGGRPPLDTPKDRNVKGVIARIRETSNKALLSMLIWLLSLFRTVEAVAELVAYSRTSPADVALLLPVFCDREIVRLLDEGDRIQVCHCLGEIRADDGRNVLEWLLATDTPGVQEAAKAALRSIPAPAAAGKRS
jgi:hypothetical protein